ncbi:MAG: GpE family phage tail protein [Candidatus Accumulibacter sp.]|nr:GpE family phage tail protein [Accumulibacter sp.]
MAYVFHFPPSELWAMTLSELEFWTNEAEKIVRAMANGLNA